MRLASLKETLFACAIATVPLWITPVVIIAFTNSKVANFALDSLVSGGLLLLSAAFVAQYLYIMLEETQAFTSDDDDRGDVGEYMSIIRYRLPDHNLLLWSAMVIMFFSCSGIFFLELGKNAPWAVTLSGGRGLIISLILFIFTLWNFYIVSLARRSEPDPVKAMKKDTVDFVRAFTAESDPDT